MLFRLSSVVGAAIIAAFGLPEVVHGGNPDAERRELVDRAAGPWNAVARWLIEYEATPSATTQGIPVHRIMAVASPSSFYHLSAHFPPEHPWQVDPFCQEYFISQGKTCHRWPFNRTYSEGRQKKGADLGGTFEYDFLLTVVPSWPLTDYKSPVSSESGTPLIPLAAMRSANYRLLPDSEPIAGEECAVFDRKGQDRIWVATKKGICVMRRDIRNPQSGRLGQRILADKVEQVAFGLWLPTEFRSQFFSAKQGAQEDAVEREYKIRILRCVLNDDVPASIFTPVHRPGSLKFKNANQFTQASPGGEDLLSDIVDFMVKYARLPTKPVPRNHPYGWFLGGLLGGLCAGLVIFGVPMRIGRRRCK